MGLHLLREARTPVFAGINGDETQTSVFRIASVRPDSPAAEAGLEAGDVITTFGGTRITPANFLKTLARYKPGDRVALTVQRARRVVQLTITLATPVTLSYRIEEIPDASPEAKALRAAWLQNRLR